VSDQTPEGDYLTAEKVFDRNPGAFVDADGDRIDDRAEQDE